MITVIRSLSSTIMAKVQNKQVIFKGYIQRVPQPSDMELKVSEIESKAPKGSGALLVKNLYLSCDTYMRGRMRDYHESYIPAFVPGQVIEGFGLSKVVDSDDPNFKPGDLITAMTGWEEYSLIKKTEELRKIQADDIPLSYHLGPFGIPGFTAYAGFYEICSPHKGDRVFVSAASSAVGQLVGQLAKLHGCYVVGSTGSNQKVDLLKKKLGFDEAFNYKEESNLDAALKRYFPEGIDIFFDNVGGETLDAALLNMRVHGRIAGCGMVSQNGLSDPNGIHNWYQLLLRRCRMQGFLQSDFLHLYPRFLEDVKGYYKQGKIVYVEDVTEGLDSAPAAFAALFTSNSVGKQIIRVAHE